MLFFWTILSLNEMKMLFCWKIQKHGESCRAEGMVFLSLPVEYLGGWHELAVQQIKRMGNATLLKNRIPSFPDPHEDGSL